MWVRIFKTKNKVVVNMADEDELRGIIQSHIHTMEVEAKARKLAEEAEAKARKLAEEAKALQREERLAKEKQQEEERLQEFVEEKQKSFSEFYEYILPKVTEHFKKSREPLKIKALVWVQDVQNLLRKPKVEIEDDEYDPNDQGFFRIVDKQVYDNDGEWDEFHLEGDLEELGLGKGHSIPLKQILDEDMKSLLKTDPNDHKATYWQYPKVFEDWAFFYGNTQSGGRYHRVIIGRLEGSQMRLKHDYTSNNIAGYMRLCYWGERKLIADHKNKIILMINENNEVIPFPYKWAGGSAEVVSIYPLVRLCFPKSLKNRGSPYWDTIHYDRDIQYRIAYFPDMSVMFNKILVGDYFSKFGLKIEVIDSDTFIVSIPKSGELQEDDPQKFSTLRHSFYAD